LTFCGNWGAGFAVFLAAALFLTGKMAENCPKMVGNGENCTGFGVFGENCIRKCGKTSENDAKMSENGSKMAENDSEMAENDIFCENCTQNDSKMAENDSKIAENDAFCENCGENGAKMAENGRKTMAKLYSAVFFCFSFCFFTFFCCFLFLFVLFFFLKLQKKSKKKHQKTDKTTNFHMKKKHSISFSLFFDQFFLLFYAFVLLFFRNHLFVWSVFWFVRRFWAFFAILGRFCHFWCFLGVFRVFLRRKSSFLSFLWGIYGCFMIIPRFFVFFVLTFFNHFFGPNVYFKKNNNPQPAIFFRDWMALFFNHNGRFWPFGGVLIFKKAEIKPIFS
jgi:hypothetical protein